MACKRSWVRVPSAPPLVRTLSPVSCAEATNSNCAQNAGVYTLEGAYILIFVAKHLIDIDEKALSAARAELGTDTIKATVNAALRAACHARASRVAAALDALADAELDDREHAWR